MVLYAIVIDPVYRDIQNVAHHVQVVKSVDGLNRGPTAMALRSSASQRVARRGNGSHGEARRWAAAERSRAIGFRHWSGGGAGLIVTGGRWLSAAKRCDAEDSVALLSRD